MTTVRKTEFSGLLSPHEFNSDRVRMWAKSERYKVAGGWINPEGNRTGFTFPLSDPGLFLSFARLGAHGEPSERSIQRWVSEHGLLRGKDNLSDSWPGEWPKVGFTQEEWDQFIESRITEDAMSVEEFRTEVRFANQLLNLYADILRFVARTKLPWPRRAYSRYQSTTERLSTCSYPQSRTRCKTCGCP
jgi:hypothetical protein